MDVRSKEVRVGRGMVKSMQPEEKRTRLGRKKLISLTGP